MDDPDSRERKSDHDTAHDAVEIPIKRWRQLLHQNQGGSLSITVSSRKKGEMVSIFSLHVGCIH